MRSLRQPILAANWKMHFLEAEVRRYAGRLVTALAQDLPKPAVEIVLFAPFPWLVPLRVALDGAPVAIGAQDLSDQARGAFTGEVSGEQLRDAGCRWVLVGHSERRRRHGEDDACVARKVMQALQVGLQPLVCVGETLEERENGTTWEVLRRQLAALPGHPSLTLAYEPVWAIGTGRSASPEQASEAHRFLRQQAAELWGEPSAQRLRILYGGSVTPTNAAGFAAAPEVDGALVGGASLDPDQFLDILMAFISPP